MGDRPVPHTKNLPLLLFGNYSHLLLAGTLCASKRPVVSAHTAPRGPLLCSCPLKAIHLVRGLGTPLRRTVTRVPEPAASRGGKLTASGSNTGFPGVLSCCHPPFLLHQWEVYSLEGKSDTEGSGRGDGDRKAGTPSRRVGTVTALPPAVGPSRLGAQPRSLPR